MERRSRTSLALPATLIVLSAIPIVISLVRLFQVPLSALPDDAFYFDAVPVWHFIHAAAGALFGVLGPLQFGRVLAGRFGRAHRVAGRIFIGAGALLALSSLRLLWQFPGHSTALLDLARLAAGLALGASLILAVLAIRRRHVLAHRAWMIRAYAIGMGVSTVSLIFFPIYIVTGEPVEGLASDIVFVAAWSLNLVLAEWVIRRRPEPGAVPLPVSAR